MLIKNIYFQKLHVVWLPTLFPSLQIVLESQAYVQSNEITTQRMNNGDYEKKKKDKLISVLRSMINYVTEKSLKIAQYRISAT